MAFSLTQPLYGQGGSYTAQQDRLLIKANTVTAGVRKLTAASGGVMTGDLAVTTTGAGNGSVNVAAGEVVVAHTTSGQGYYFAVNDASTVVGSFAANSSGNPRIDLVTVLVTDTGATPSVAFSIVQGTPAASPVAPTPPAGSTAMYLTLAQVTIPNGFTVTTTVAAGNIVDVRPKAFVPDLSATALNSTVVPSPTHGNLAYQSTDQRLNTYNASAVEGARWENVPERTGFRNIVINGKMDIAQRATSVSSISSDAAGSCYSVDRWVIQIGTAGTFTSAQVVDAPTGTDFRNSYKLSCTTANGALSAGSYFTTATRFEGQDLQHFRKGTANGKPFTVSFWVKAFQAGTYCVELLDVTNTRSVSATYTVAASGTWQFVTVTFPADTTGQFANDNTRALDLTFWLAAGTTFAGGTLQTAWATLTNANRAVGQTNLASSTSNYWQITGVQLEAGSVPSQFERRPFATELALCQRYYYRAVISGSNKAFCLGWADSATVFVGTFPFPVPLRSVPTAMETTGTATDYAAVGPAASMTASSIVYDGTTTSFNGTIVLSGAGGLTTGRGGQIRSNTAGTSYLGWSAEL